MNTDLPVPPITPETAPYWNAARDGKLLLQRCVECRLVRFYPRTLCPGCWSDRAEWTEASGRGRIHSFTIIRRPPAPAFTANVPYVVALIDLEEGLRMMANIVGDGALDAAIDDAATVTPGLTGLALNAQAARCALDDAGLTFKDVDALVTAYSVSEPYFMYGTVLCEYLGLKPGVCASMTLGGAT